MIASSRAELPMMTELWCLIMTGRVEATNKVPIP
jgi:hypothetical protein